MSAIGRYVPRMLRHKRVHARLTHHGGALLIRGPPFSDGLGPGSAEQRRRSAAPRPGHDPSRFEETGGGFLRGALLGGGRLQAFDLGGEKRDALAEFLDGKERKVLPDLVTDLLSRLVVIFSDHMSAP